MAWAYEAIPPLQKHFTDYPNKVSHPRILRWLAAVESSKKNTNKANLFNTPDDVVVHPWIMTTIDEMGMTSFLTLGLVDTKKDPAVELIKKELDGAISIRRAVRQYQSNVEALHDQTQTVTDPGASSGGVAGGVICDGGIQPMAASSANLDYEYVGAQQKINMFKNTPCTGPSFHPYIGPSHLYTGPSHPSSPSYSHYKCKVYKDREDKLLNKLEAIAEAAEELKSRRGVIPPTRQILSILKSAKIATPLTPIVVEVQGPPKKVDIFAALGKEKKKELKEFIKMKIKKEYTMHSFAAKDFSNITNICVWFEDKYVDEILCLMRGRQLAYSDAYDATDRIMDLNFYNNFKDRYAKLCKIADSGGPELDQLVSTFQWDEEAIKYVREKRSYPHGKS
ncbi:hypothetical protein P3S68_022609 [Capsicum galapagoense]